MLNVPRSAPSGRDRPCPILSSIICPDHASRRYSADPFEQAQNQRGIGTVARMPASPAATTRRGSSSKHAAAYIPPDEHAPVDDRACSSSPGQPRSHETIHFARQPRAHEADEVGFNLKIDVFGVDVVFGMAGRPGAREPRSGCAARPRSVPETVLRLAEGIPYCAEVAASPTVSITRGKGHFDVDVCSSRCETRSGAHMNFPSLIRSEQRNSVGAPYETPIIWRPSRHGLYLRAQSGKRWRGRSRTDGTADRKRRQKPARAVVNE